MGTVGVFTYVLVFCVRAIFDDFIAWEFAFWNRNGVISYLLDVFTDTINHLLWCRYALCRSVRFVISVTHFDFTCDIHTHTRINSRAMMAHNRDYK